MYKANPLEFDKDTSFEMYALSVAPHVWHSVVPSIIKMLCDFSFN